MASLPMVFVPQVPSKFDDGSKLWVPTVNMAPAEKYGEIKVMLPPGANRLHSVPLLHALREQMRDYNEHDYIVAIGDPTLIAATAVIATKKANGLLRLLKWDRMAGDYILMELRP